MRRYQPSDFWARVAVGGKDECWPWTGATMPKGYGRVRYQGARWGTHRLALVLSGVAVPAGAFVCHRCDHPPCCNPAHLFVGSAAANSHDCLAKGRHALQKRPPRGAACPTARLSADQVLEIRRRLIRPLSVRALAREFGVVPRTIYRIKTGETWWHLGAAEEVAP